MSKVAVIIPCYNEEESLPQLFEKLSELTKNHSNYFFYFIFVDDGSTDNTYELLRQKSSEFPGSIVVRHEKNMNLGAALRTGITHATNADVIAFLDSDCTYDPGLVIQLVSEIEKGADLATVSPYHPRGAVAGVPEWRLFLSRGLSFIYRKLLRSDLYTYTAMVRAVRANLAAQLVNDRNDFTFVTLFLLKALREGYKVTEVPATLNVRRFGVSKMRLVNTIAAQFRIIFLVLQGKQ
jgi:dolichol-phosphate mannosyltransferase